MRSGCRLADERLRRPGEPDVTSGCAISRQAVLPPPQPIEQNDNRDDEQDDAEHPERVHHLRLPSNTSPSQTNATHTAAPISINRQERGCLPTHWPRTRAAAARFANSRNVSPSATLCRGSIVASS